MAIYKKINGTGTKLADNSIVDHSQLSGRDQYNAHPISAIRKLPEKLTELKDKSKENEQAIKDEHDRAVLREDTIEDNAQRISLVDNNNGTLTFTNYDNETNTVKAGHLVDNQTIKEIDNNSTLEVIGVKGTFIKDEESITKTYDAEDIYDDIESAKGIKLEQVLDQQDNPTGELKFTDYTGNETTVQGGFLADEDTITINSNNKIALKKVYVDSDTLIGDGASSNTKLNAKAIKDNNGTITVIDINNMNQEIQSIQGRGGYLRPYDFQTARPDLPIDDLISDPPIYSALTQYALQEITNITDPIEIFNGTRVTNLFNNHTWILNNTQDTDPKVFEWVDLGQSLVSTATNDTLGVVKGSDEDLKVSVDLNGVMSINGLPELSDLVGDTTLNTQADTITGAINELNNGKQSNLTAGANIQINNNVISATDTKYTAGNGLNLNNNQFSVNTNVIQSKLTFDNTPTENSSNPVTSDGIYNAIENKIVMTIHR